MNRRYMISNLHASGEWGSDRQRGHFAKWLFTWKRHENEPNASVTSRGEYETQLTIATESNHRQMIHKWRDSH